MKARTINLLTNAAVACSWAFAPTLASGLGAGPAGVGLIVALYAFAVLLSNWIFGRLADIVGTRRVLQAGLLASSLAFLVQILASNVFESPEAYGVARFATGLAIGSFPPALIAHAHHGGTKMGKFASWGALGWAVGVFTAGLMLAYWQMFAASSLLAVCAFAVALTVKEEASVKARIPFFPYGIVRRNYKVYLALLLRHTGASMVWMFFPLYLAALGASHFLIGLIFTMNALGQFVIMPLLDRFGGRSLIAAGLFASTAVLAAFAVAGNAYTMFPLQFLLAASWSLTYVGCLKEITERNLETATASGLMQAVISASAVVGPLAGGLILASAGRFLSELAAFRWTIIAGSAVALAALVFFLASTWGEPYGSDKSGGGHASAGEKS